MMVSSQRSSSLAKHHGLPQWPPIFLLVPREGFYQFFTGKKPQLVCYLVFLCLFVCLFVFVSCINVFYPLFGFGCIILYFFTAGNHSCFKFLRLLRQLECHDSHSWDRPHVLPFFSALVERIAAFKSKNEKFLD